jgi:hypothetical protein
MSADRLTDELGAELPASVAALPEADLARLADLLGTARRDQSAALAEATEKGLGFVPRLLRGPVTKVLLR